MRTLYDPTHKKRQKPIFIKTLQYWLLMVSVMRLRRKHPYFVLFFMTLLHEKFLSFNTRI